MDIFIGEYNTLSEEIKNSLTFSDFLSVFSLNLDKDPWYTSKWCNAYGITSEDARRYFCNEFKPNKEDYERSLWAVDKKKDKKNVQVDIERLKRHTYITGRSGSGKSELLKTLIRNIHINRPQDSIVVIDPHGKLTKELAIMDGLDRKRIMYVDPLFHKQCIYNPLEVEDKDNLNVAIKAEQVVSFINEMISEGELSTNMKALLIPCLTAIIYHYEEPTLLHLIDFLDYKKIHRATDIGLENKIEIHRQFFESGRFADKSYSVTKSAVQKKLQRLLNYEVFSGFTIGKSTFSLEDEVENAKTILLPIKPTVGTESHEAIGRLLVASISGVAKKRSDGYENRGQIFLVIDEFQNFVTDSMKYILSQARKWGVCLILANQNINQITDTVLRDEILGNTEIKIAGVNHPHVSKTIIEGLGIDKKDWDSLKQFEFFIKIGDENSFKFQSLSDTIDDTCSVKEPKEYLKAYAEDYYYIEEINGTIEKLKEKLQVTLDISDF